MDYVLSVKKKEQRVTSDDKSIPGLSRVLLSCACCTTALLRSVPLPVPCSQSDRPVLPVNNQLKIEI